MEYEASHGHALWSELLCVSHESIKNMKDISGDLSLGLPEPEPGEVARLRSRHQLKKRTRRRQLLEKEQQL